MELTKQLACKWHQEAGVFASEYDFGRETDQWDSLWGKVCLEPAYILQKPKRGNINYEFWSIILKFCGYKYTFLSNSFENKTLLLH